MSDFKKKNIKYKITIDTRVDYNRWRQLLAKVTGGGKSSYHPCYSPLQRGEVPLNPIKLDYSAAYIAS